LVDKLPGQKNATPAESDGTRIFYESLLSQNKDSKLALKWLMEHGCLPAE
jgi:hypothetical protein